MKSWPLLILAAVFGLCAWFLVGDRSASGADDAAPAVETASGRSATPLAEAGADPGAAAGGDAVARDAFTAADAAAIPEERGFAGPAARLRLRLVDGAGEPVEDAGVRLGYRRDDRSARPAFDPEAWRERPPIRADEDGRVDVPMPAKARFHVEVRGPHWRSQTRDLQPLAPGEEADLGEISLSPAVRVHGTVRDAEGRPVADASVRLEEDGRAGIWGGGWSRSTRSDEEGRWELPGVPPGRFVIQAHAQGFARTRLRGVRLDLDERDHAVPVVLAPGEAVTGFVVDADERPVPGARVFVFPWREQFSFGNSRPSIPDEGDPAATADERGRFRVTGFGDGRPPLVAATAPGFDAAYAEPDGAGERLVLRLQRLPALSGRVLDPDGEPVPGARLRLTQARNWGGERELEAVEADAEGRFAFSPRTAETCLVHAEDPEGGLAATKRVQAEAYAEPLDLHLAPRRALSVRVTGSGGAPLEDARVEVRRPGGRGNLDRLNQISLRGEQAIRMLEELDRRRGRWQARTGADGVARLHGVDPDRYRLTVRASDHAPHEREFVRTDEEQEIEVALDEGAALRVVLVDSAGAPVSGVPVALKHRESGEQLPETESDALGRAVWNALAPGGYEVSYRATGAQRGWIWSGQDEEESVTTVPMVALAAGETEELRITVRDLATVTAVVTRAGAPAAGVHVRLEEVDVRRGFGGGNFEGSPVTDGRGRAQLPPVEAGSYEVVVKPSRSAPENRERVELAPGPRTVAVEVHGGEVVGQLLGAGGPLAGARVSLQPHQPVSDEEADSAHSIAVIAISDSNGNVQIEVGRSDEQTTNATTDAQGRYRFVDVPPGHWTVRARASGHGIWTSLPFETRGTGTHDLGARRLLAGAVIHGHDHNFEPRDEENGPPGFSFGQSIRLQDGEGNMLSISRLDEDGDFRFEDLAGGTYRLASRRWQSEPIELRAGEVLRVDVPVERDEDDAEEDR